MGSLAPSSRLAVGLREEQSDPDGWAVPVVPAVQAQGELHSRAPERPLEPEIGAERAVVYFRGGGDVGPCSGHTAASLAVSAGGNVLALARMLGHEDPSLTLRTYADLFDSDLDALADVLDRHRTEALQPSIANGDNETDEENVPDTLQQSA